MSGLWREGLSVQVGTGRPVSEVSGMRFGILLHSKGPVRRPGRMDQALG